MLLGFGLPKLLVEVLVSLAGVKAAGYANFPDTSFFEKIVGRKQHSAQDFAKANAAAFA